MKNNFKAIVLAALAMTAAVSCSSSDDSVEYVEPNYTTTYLANGATLPTTISNDTVLSANCSYELDGAVTVTAGATLYIKAGVTITATSVSEDYYTEGSEGSMYVDDPAGYRYILVAQGAKIDAQGTPNNPIVMTSVTKSHGAWGGVHICGKAPINNGDGTPKVKASEIGSLPFGGDDAYDNSGVMKFVILKYTGQSMNDEQECNGVSFYGVGRGTDISYLHAYKGSDDGFEFFGGTVDVHHMIATDCQDDSFDWTDGWVGRGQFLVAEHLTANCDALLECDNYGDNVTATPISKPVLSNVTLIGKDNGSKTQGVMLKAGTQIELYNAIIAGKSESIYTKTNETDAALKDGTSVLKSVVMTGSTIATNLESATYTISDFMTSGLNNQKAVSFSATNATGYYAAVSGTAFDATDLNTSAYPNAFFVEADYIGAVDSSDNWTSYLKVDAE